MRTPWRRQRVPSGVREATDILPGERVLATARSRESAYLVATSAALSLVTPNPSSDDDSFLLAWRIRWDQIDNARWEAPDLTMTVRGDGLAEADAPRQIRTEVDKIADLPAVVRDRVSESILVSEQIPVEGGSVRAVARRHSATGETTWRITTGTGINLNDPGVREQAEEGLAVLRSRLGV